MGGLKVLKETFLMSLPLVGVMAVVLIFIAPFENTFDYVRLAVSYAGVVIGQSLFLFGLDISILPVGEMVGKNIAKIKKVAWIVLFGLFFGLLATVAEPALAVLAKQTNMLIEEVNRGVFIWVMGIGIGIFVGLSMWRIMKNVSIKIVFALLYALIFLMIIFVPQEFVALAFDGSGATTGDISVPFILALGLGVSVSLSKRKESEDVFGIIGIASAGPILTVFIYGMILKRVHGNIPPVDSYDPSTAGTNFLQILISNLGNVSFAILPMLIVILPFQFFIMKLPKKDFKKMLIGIIPVFAGLLIFLSGIDFGFAFAGQYMGTVFLSSDRPVWFKWLLLPMSFVLGAAITLTEPAVAVLSEKLEEITEGKIKQMTIRITLALGIGVAAMLAVVKILTETNILWFLAPLYLIAIIMMRFTPRLFVGLAFDSGGVTGGALTSAVLTPLTLGIAGAVAAGVGHGAQSVLTNGFGIIAFISVTPLIAVQILGMYVGRVREDE